MQLDLVRYDWHKQRIGASSELFVKHAKECSSSMGYNYLHCVFTTVRGAPNEHGSSNYTHVYSE